MPSGACATLCKVVVRRQRDFWRFLGAAQVRCGARGCGRRARKRPGEASTLQISPRARRARVRAACDPEGSRQNRATRCAQNRRSALTVKRTRACAAPTTRARSAQGTRAREAAGAACARGDAPQNRLTRWRLASPWSLAGRQAPRRTRHHALPLRLCVPPSWCAAFRVKIFDLFS